MQKSIHFPLFTAFQEVWRKGYSLQDLQSDCLAGLAVSVIAIPLAMALSIAAGATPQQGLYTVMIGAPIIALCGGSRLSVSGPTAAFIIILFPVVQQYGMSGLLLATFMAGVLLICMGIIKLGRFIEFIPYPVTVGFTAGIGMVIASLQIKDFFGLSIGTQPSSFVDRIILVTNSFSSLNIQDAYIGGLTLLVMIVWPRFKVSLPSHLIAVLIGSSVAMGLMALFPHLHIETIGSRFQEISNALPSLMVPWGSQLSLKMLHDLVGPAFAIALLAAIESLLCATVLDGMTGTKHHPNTELIAQGIGNMVVPFFGGITATSAIARSVVNLRAGARSPIAAVLHGIFVLLAVIWLAPTFSYIPMASLSALLLVTAWNISDVKHLTRIIRMGPKSDIFVLVICFTLTVLIDMVMAITVGVVLAALLFMKEMASLSKGQWLLESKELEMHETLPTGVMVYEISGPLFFGAAEKAMHALKTNQLELKVAILHLKDVPTMDASGLVAFQSAITTLQETSIFVILTEIQPKVLKILNRGGIHPIEGKLNIVATMHASIALAKEYC